VIHRGFVAVTRCIEAHGRQGDWLAGEVLPTLRPVGQELCVETTDVHAMATRWGASVGDLNQTVAPTGLGLSRQTSAAAVNAAHIDVTAFTTGLAARVGERASDVVQADLSYLFQEAASTAKVAAIFQPTISE
jgi:hypothetical protein